jgi:hypothetical protein
MADKPIYHAFSVRKYKKEDGSDDAYWTKIGVVFAHKDGKGYDVVLDCLPVDGRISIREPREKSAQALPSGG